MMLRADMIPVKINQSKVTKTVNEDTMPTDRQPAVLKSTLQDVNI